LKSGIGFEPGSASFHHPVHAVLKLRSLVHVDVADAQAASFGVGHALKNALEVK
jgi:hypothetical protein